MTFFNRAPASSVKISSLYFIRRIEAILTRAFTLAAFLR
jgi:hypothetical protein